MFLIYTLAGILLKAKRIRGTAEKNVFDVFLPQLQSVTFAKIAQWGRSTLRYCKPHTKYHRVKH